MARHHRFLPSAAVTLFLIGSHAWAQTNLSRDAQAKTDIYTIAGEGPEHLLDDDRKTNFLLQRVLDSEFRIIFAGPAQVQQLTLEQGYEDWSLAEELEIEAADGSVTTVTLSTKTREPQVFPIAFPQPTAFVDVRVTKATLSKKGETFGGIATMRFEGALTGAKASPPVLENIQIDKANESTATIRFTTNEPAACRVRFSEQAQVSNITPYSAEQKLQHEIAIVGTSKLLGQIEIRCADGDGNRTEQRHDAFTTIDTRFQWGMGGWAFKFNDKWYKATDTYKRDGLKIDFAQIWTADNNWQAYVKPEDLRALYDEGVLPEVIHFYLGYVTQAEVAKVRQDYLDDVRALAKVLKDSGVGDKVLVTLEPEYNQGDVIEWDGWNDLMIEAIQILHEEANAKVGLLPGPWDIGHRVPLSMGRAAAHADFVALQSMAGSVTDTREDMAHRVEDSLRFTRYLNRKFLRPVRLGYLMISDYGGWLDVQRDVLIEYCERKNEFEAAGLTSISWMGYVDNPDADGALGAAEAHKGLRYPDGSPKPAFWVFKECVKNGPSWLSRGESPPGEIPESDEGCGCRLAAPRGKTPAHALAILALCAGLAARCRMRAEKRQLSIP